MCKSMVDIQPAAAEIRRGIKKIEDRNNRAKIYWSALLHRATIIRYRQNTVKQLWQLVDHLWLHGLPEEMKVLTESDRYYNDASHVLYATCTDRIQVYLSRALWYVDLQITVVVSFLLPLTYQTKPSVL